MERNWRVLRDKMISSCGKSRVELARQCRKVLAVIGTMSLKRADRGGKPGQAHMIKQASNPFYDA